MKKLLLTSLLMFAAAASSACSFTYNYFVPAYPSGNQEEGGGGGGEETGIEDSGTYDIKIWCDQRIAELTQTQVQQFVTDSAGKYKINLTIDELGEDSAASQMTEDVQSGADIYVFAQDQLSKLKTAGALAAITGDQAKAVANETEAGGAEAASLNGKLYAFPFTNDNGYFMYYNKKVVKEEHVANIEDIIADCEAQGKTINYSVFGNGFYAASYFMATGCESTWDINSSNKFYQYHDNYNSDAGVIAAKGIKYLKQHNIFGNSDDPSKFSKNLGVCVSGIWNYQYALDAIGDDLGCAPMPSFTVDGTKYHISSFKGYKLLGVKPQTDSKKVSVCKRIARYLSSKVCQVQRFRLVGWGPTNKQANQEPEILNHPGLKALREQSAFAKTQVQCPSSWFSSVSSLANSIMPNASDADIRAALASYEANLESFLGD